MYRLPLISLLALVACIAPAQNLERQPYPQNMRSYSVDIIWRTDIPTETWVEVRERDNPTSPALVYYSNVPTTAHEIRVPGLKPDTHYKYRVGYGADNYLVDEPIPFQTFPDGDLETYTFVAYGDHRNHPEDHRAVVEAIIEKSKKEGWPRFVLDTGDFTGQGEHKTDFWNEQFFDPARGLIDRVCFFPAVGNHETFTRHPRIAHRYLQNFSVPTENSGTEYYYSFDFADAHFCVIDAYATDFTTGSKQYEWIKQDLNKSEKRWKFAMLHYPIYIHRTAPSVSYGNIDIREHLVPLFERYGVAAVISGDSHFYQRSEVSGIAYICTGGGGAPLYDPGDGKDYVRASKKVHHYAWFTMTGDQMKMDVFDRDNNLIDSLTTGPRATIRPPAPKINFEQRLPDDTWTTGTTLFVECRDTQGKLTAAPAYSEEGGMADSTAKSKAPGLTGVGTRFSDNSEADSRFRFTPPITEAGTYLLSVTVPVAGSIDAPNTLFEVESLGKEIIRGKVPLTTALAGDRWYDIGLFELAPGATITFIESEEEPDRFYADSIRLVRMTPK